MGGYASAMPTDFDQQNDIDRYVRSAQRRMKTSGCMRRDAFTLDRANRFHA